MVKSFSLSVSQRRTYFLWKSEADFVHRHGSVFEVIPAGHSFEEATILSGGIQGASNLTKVISCVNNSNQEAAEQLSFYSPLSVVILKS